MIVLDSLTLSVLALRCIDAALKGQISCSLAKLDNRVSTSNWSTESSLHLRTENASSNDFRSNCWLYSCKSNRLHANLHSSFVTVSLPECLSCQYSYTLFYTRSLPMLAFDLSLLAIVCLGGLSRLFRFCGLKYFSTFANSSDYCGFTKWYLSNSWILSSVWVCLLP